MRVAGRNKYGWGPYSSVVEILAAVVPTAPSPASTTQNGLFSLLTWTAPAGNGSAIESYDIEIEATSGAFSESTTCTGSDPSLTSCSVAYTELRSIAFGLSLGDEIVVRIRAVNEIGPGSYSAVNDSGDIVRTEPLSPPLALSEGSTTDDS